MLPCFPVKRHCQCWHSAVQERLAKVKTICLSHRDSLPPPCTAEVFVLVFAIFALLVDYSRLNNALLSLVATSNVFVINLISA